MMVLTPLSPPLSGGKEGPSPIRPSPDKGRMGGVMLFLRALRALRGSKLNIFNA
jgi:hypothetical protein